MKRRNVILLAIFICLICPLQGIPRNDYMVDWKKGTVVSFGRAEISVSSDGTPVDEHQGRYQSVTGGRLDCYRKAKEQAVVNLVKALKTIRVDADNTLKGFLKKETVTQSRLYSIIDRKTRFKEYPQNYYGTECRAELKIGEILEAIPYRYPAEEFPSLEETPIRTRYTGLIIDARGLDVEPMLLPSIYNESGLEIYGRYQVDIKAASYTGMVSYVYSEQEAFRHRKAGSHPYVTVAVRAMNGCPVITSRDMRRLFGHSETRENLKKCRVIFILSNKKETSG